MAEIITMPKLGFDMQEGTLANWVKEVGDTIVLGDIIVEVETDKATVEVEAFSEGTLLKLLVEPGDIVEVGAPIAILGESGEDISDLVGQLLKGDGEEPIGSPIPLGQAPEEPSPPVLPEKPAADKARESEEVAARGDGGRIKASPIARRLAAEKGIDLAKIRGTGPGGRITRTDVEDYRPRDSKALIPVEKKARDVPRTESGIGGVPTYKVLDIPHEVIEVSRLRATIARRMVESKQFVPHFTVTMSIETSPMLKLRKEINATLDEDSKVTVNDMVIKATALALRQFPNLNTHYHGEKLIRYKDIHVGVAVALPQGGLINVVARNADKTTLSVMARQNKEMIARARDGKVKLDDIEGSTFTVSNLGAFGVEFFTAIINPPEAGILAIGASRKVPVFDDEGNVTAANLMKVTMSVDHRTSDGAEGADFVKALKILLENPMRLLV